MSVLLASCSATSDLDQPFGFAVAPTPASPTTAANSDFAGNTVNSAASTMAMVYDEDDPELPDTVAEAPVLRPGSEVSLGTLAGSNAASETQVIAAVPAPDAQPVQVVDVAPTMVASEQEATEAVAAPAATHFLENAAPQPQQVAVAAPQPEKRGFLASFFGPARAQAAPAPIQAARPLIAARPAQQEAERPVIQMASTGPIVQASVRNAVIEGDALPGVREGSLFEISRRSGLDDDSDVDLHEDGGAYQVASAAGLARLAPNGLLKQRDDVDVACLKPSLVRVLKSIEGRFGRKVVITSGYRDPDRNRRARGARNSLHMYCAAADIQVPGVSKIELASFVRGMPGRGGVGTYCHTESVHIDVGPERDWNWRCRRRR